MSLGQSLIDLAGSEKATSDKDRTREGKYINTRLAFPKIMWHEMTSRIAS